MRWVMLTQGDALFKQTYKAINLGRARWILTTKRTLLNRPAPVKTFLISWLAAVLSTDIGVFADDKRRIQA